ELAADERFQSNADRLKHREVLGEILGRLLKQHKAADFAQILLKKGVPAAPVLNVEELLRHPHTRHRGMVLEKGGYRAIASPIKLSRTPAGLRRLPPAFGEHTEAVRQALDLPEP